MICPLCGYEFDTDSLSCRGRCPMAQLQGCNLLCCPNCGYQLVDERQSKAAQWLRQWLKPAPPKAQVKSDLINLSE